MIGNELFVESITYTVNVDAEPISLEVRARNHEFFDIVISQEFIQPDACLLSRLEFGL
jgi:hypothetical protein